MASPAATAAAFFDVDGTVLRGNIVRYYVHLRTRRMGRLGRWLWIAAFLPRVALFLLLDRVDRARMNRVFYAGYRGLDAAAARRAAEEDYGELLGRHVFPAARARIAWHRARGERVVLLTGSLDFLVAPLARDLGADDVIAVRMEEAEGKLTGRLLGQPLAGEEKARAAREWAAAHGADLARCWAYGDSPADLPLLAAVGHGVAVNPGRRLSAMLTELPHRVERWGADGDRPEADAVAGASPTDGGGRP